MAFSIKQGRFWEFHDALFANQAKLDEPSLNAIAQTPALDEKLFQSCLASGESKTQVSRDQEDGRKAGIGSTEDPAEDLLMPDTQTVTEAENPAGADLKAHRRHAAPQGPCAARLRLRLLASHQ